ncbi:hypothetical protein ABVK25_012526 [Lepraria finkii]|uniref:Uncharacterized protein n=1 Tax=Lepraria finkii TaxID=1340010 RepID=A0ABR4AJW0_9LECA
MALDHVPIEPMEAEDDAGMDLESILRYGTDAIFKEDDAEDDIRYDSASVDKLLDRSGNGGHVAPGEKTALQSLNSVCQSMGQREEEGLTGRRRGSELLTARTLTWCLGCHPFRRTRA